MDTVKEERRYANGQLKARATFNEDSATLLVERWDENGQLIESLTYKDGIKVANNEVK